VWRVLFYKTNFRNPNLFYIKYLGWYWWVRCSLLTVWFSFFSCL
jgi:hypothetical protein